MFQFYSGLIRRNLLPTITTQHNWLIFQKKRDLAWYDYDSSITTPASLLKVLVSLSCWVLWSLITQHGCGITCYVRVCLVKSVSICPHILTLSQEVSHIPATSSPAELWHLTQQSSLSWLGNVCRGFNISEKCCFSLLIYKKIKCIRSYDAHQDAKSHTSISACIFSFFLLHFYRLAAVSLYPCM